jgi:hypothetical protein
VVDCTGLENRQLPARVREFESHRFRQMAHLVQSMAYVGETPWHELGNQLPAKQPIEVWAREAGMDWTIRETPVRYMTEQAGALGSIMSFDEQKVLYRSDTKAPLSVVSGRYQVVQPKEVLEFYRDLTEVSGFELETAGVLKAGRKFWALARTGKKLGAQGQRCGQWLSAAGHVLRWHAGHHGHTHHGPRGLQQHPLDCPEWCPERIKVPHSTSFDAQRSRSSWVSPSRSGTASCTA